MPYVTYSEMYPFSRCVNLFETEMSLAIAISRQVVGMKLLLRDCHSQWLGGLSASPWRFKVKTISG